MELKNLGKQTPHVLEGADASLLERVPNPLLVYLTAPGSWGQITITGDEFTSLCPATGGPDFGSITIIYTPQDWIVESKSLKYYLESYRNQRIFHEAVVAKICQDLSVLLKPKYLRVKGSFKPRGGWAINPECDFYSQDSAAV